MARRTTRQISAAITLLIIGGTPTRLEPLLGGLFARGDRLLGRNGDHVLGPDLAGDDRDVHLGERLAVVRVLAADEDRGTRFERAPEDEVGQRILDHSLDLA